MARRLGKNILGLIIHQVFLWVEDGEMLSNDFFLKCNPSDARRRRSS